MSMATGRESLSSPQPADEILGLLNREVLQEHLHAISYLNQDALVATLVPNRGLPNFDPAGYIISKRNDADNDSVESIRDSYDLGVVFGRSLLTRAWPDDRLEPAVGLFDEGSKPYIDEYLELSLSTPVNLLAYQQDPKLSVINRTIDLFARRCEVIMPNLMLEGPDAVLRGFYDYMTVVILADASEEKLDATYRRIIGRLQLGSRILRLAELSEDALE